VQLALAEPRDKFPNHFVGDLVHTERGCPDGHACNDGGSSVGSVWCTCNGRHMAWTAGQFLCGKTKQRRWSAPAATGDLQVVTSRTRTL
jgi:hypothetical protein